MLARLPIEHKGGIVIKRRNSTKRWSVALMLGVSLALQSAPATASDTDVSINIQETLNAEIASKHVAGAVGLVIQNGRVLFEGAAGMAGDGSPMRSDMIMRLASIGKTVTACAVMMLVEEGRLKLDDPVAKYVPSFEYVRVRRLAPNGNVIGFERPLRPVTVRDLLTHEAGLAHEGPEHDAAWQESKTTRELSIALSKIPLNFQPGTAYEYGPSYEVLAAIIETVSGETLDKFLLRRIFEPTGMIDTHFFVPLEKRPRLSAVYKRLPDGTFALDRARGQEEQASTFLAGGGGLRGTIQDYAKFAQMLLDEGSVGGRRLLRPESVRMMTSNQVGDRYPSPSGSYSWGFGVQVRVKVKEDSFGSVGTFGWNGGLGTIYWVDPKERLLGLFFTQMAVGSGDGIYDAQDAFELAMYNAIRKGPRQN